MNIKFFIYKYRTFIGFMLVLTGFAVGLTIGRLVEEVYFFPKAQIVCANQNSSFSQLLYNRYYFGRHSAKLSGFPNAVVCNSRESSNVTVPILFFSKNHILNSLEEIAYILVKDFLPLAPAGFVLLMNKEKSK
jgi:hypothetical protein